MSHELTGALVKRHAHDLRNFFNGMEMDLTLLAESTDETEKHLVFSRMRQEMRSAEVMLRSFAAKFSTEAKSFFSVVDLAEQWKVDARNLLPECSITWDVNAGNAVIQIEPGVVRSTLSDLLVLVAKKCSRMPLQAGCCLVKEQVVFHVSCAQANFDNFGNSFDKLLWASLQDFSARNDGVLEGPKSDDDGRLSCRLVFSNSPAGMDSRTRG